MPFRGPIGLNLSPEDAAVHAHLRDRSDVRCCCPTPFCRGQDSADWLSCERTCRACRPRPFTPPTRSRAFAGRVGRGTAEGANDG